MRSALRQRKKKPVLCCYLLVSNKRKEKKRRNVEKIMKFLWDYFKIFFTWSVNLNKLLMLACYCCCCCCYMCIFYCCCLLMLLLSHCSYILNNHFVGVFVVSGFLFVCLFCLCKQHIVHVFGIISRHKLIKKTNGKDAKTLRHIENYYVHSFISSFVL